MPNFDARDPIKCGGVLALMESAAIGLTTAKLAKAATQNDVTVISANGAVPTSGIASVVGGTGIAGLTLAAPTPGCRCTINIASITSGTVVVTCATGVTLGVVLGAITTKATFDAAADQLVLIYGAANKWLIVSNVGTVALS